MPEIVCVFCASANAAGRTVESALRNAEVFKSSMRTELNRVRRIYGPRLNVLTPLALYRY